MSDNASPPHHHRFINAVFWNPPHWRPLARPAPPTTGNWARLLAQVSDDSDLEWLMIDASHVKVHQDGTGAAGGNQAVGRTKGG